MPSFGLFRKQKKQTQSEQSTLNVAEQQSAPSSEAPVQENKPEAPVEVVAPENPASPELTPAPVDTSVAIETPSEPVIMPTPAGPQSKTYLKAMPLRDLSDLEGIKTEVQNGNILILRITPLASKSIESVKSAVNDLYAFAESIGGDIARLGDERVVICPKNIRIWREKAPVKNDEPPTTAA
jgi:SepF-like predicted cell division protein (DUF552 family)